MHNDIQKSLIQQTTAYLIDLNINDIQLLTNGFISQNCNTKWLTILINCINNIEIFNTEQLNTINILLNKLRYV